MISKTPPVKTTRNEVLPTSVSVCFSFSINPFFLRFKIRSVTYSSERLLFCLTNLTGSPPIRDETKIEHRIELSISSKLYNVILTLSLTHRYYILGSMPFAILRASTNPSAYPMLRIATSSFPCSKNFSASCTYSSAFSKIS